MFLFRLTKLEVNSKKYKLYREVFFGTGKYPLWSGYTIGYYILKEYLKQQKEINWEKIIKTKPKVILKEYINQEIK